VATQSVPPWQTQPMWITLPAASTIHFCGFVVVAPASEASIAWM
jgi:hypothetical protein